MEKEIDTKQLATGRTSSSAPASAPLQKQITDLCARLAATTEGSPEQNSVYAELDWLVTLAELDRTVHHNR